MADRLFFAKADVLRTMVEELTDVATIPTDVLKRLGDVLGKQNGLLTAARLATLVSECIPDERQGAAVFSALQNLRPDAIPEADRSGSLRARMERQLSAKSTDSGDQSEFKADGNVIHELGWIQSSERILHRLENQATGKEERWTAVLFAETTEFQASEIPRLLRALSRFISENRFATDEDIITAVGASIRKYAMNMGEEHFESYAKWLLPSQTETLGHELELELTKALGWRLTYAPLTIPAAYPSLLQTVGELSNSYLNARLILQKNHASTVLHGIIAVAVLEAVAGESLLTQDLIGTAVNMHVAWFLELLSDRLAEAIETIRGHSPGLADRLGIKPVDLLLYGAGTTNASEKSVR